MKPIVVLDSSTVVAGIGWGGGAARSVLVLLAQRAFISIRTPWLAAEWGDAVERTAKTVPSWRNPNWVNWLEWLKLASTMVEDPPLKRIVRRDTKDDPVIAAAVAHRAQYLVAFDRDLLVLGKPYGVACLTPRAFLSALVKL